MSTHADHSGQGETAKALEKVSIKHLLEKLKRAVSKVVTIDEDAIFKSKDWPYLWPKK
jgi:hypothetical protein